MIEKLSSSPMLSNSNKQSDILIQRDKIEEITNIEQQESTPTKKEKEQIEGIVKGLNDFVNISHTHLKFEFHDELERYYVTVIDNETQEVIKEIPPRKLLDMHAAMMEFMGLLVDKKI